MEETDEMQVEPLNTDYAGRKIWLVKVPHFVAKQWRAVCDKAMNEGDEDVGPVLGSIRIAPPNASDSSSAAASSGPQFSLKLDNEATADVPQYFPMQVASRVGPAMLAFSDNGGHMAGEGVVQHRLDVEARGRLGGGAQGGGSLTVDPAYRKLARERQKAASVKTRTVQIMTDNKITNIRRPVGAETVAMKRKGETEKRVAMPKDELQPVLFRLFERQAQWAFPQLQRQTAQPAAHLKTMLGEIAVQNKRGPYRDLWELKKEFRTSGNGSGNNGGEEAG